MWLCMLLLAVAVASMGVLSHPACPLIRCSWYALQRGVAAAVVAAIGAGAAALLFTGNASIISTTLAYWQALWVYWRGGSIAATAGYLDSTHSRAHVYSLVTVLRLWNLPHYRSGTFQEDMVRNLRNVAVPGTGVPLSAVCHAYWSVVAFLVLGYPVLAFVAGYRGTSSTLAARFKTHLLSPTDWFSLWRLNCSLASLHAHVTGSTDYNMEDKWTFICEAQRQQIPVTPCLDIKSLVVKNKNEEGGLGINFFLNALFGGDWILQKAYTNSDFVASLLPDNAPLSTLRLVTASRGALDESANTAAELITVLSCVFRAGRQNALTDHSAILFDVDLNTGTIRKGTVNSQWYQLGLQHVCRQSEPQVYHSHPDTGVQVSNNIIPHFPDILRLVQEAHFKTCRAVPLCGWDVALTSSPADAPNGIMLLEVNLSCNFFQASLDYGLYFTFVHDCFSHLHQRLQEKKDAETHTKG